MRTPILRAKASAAGLVSPSVGRWKPNIGVSDPVEEGVVLGRLLQAGSWREIRAPTGVRGVVDEVLAAHTRVECGTLIVGFVTEGDACGITEAQCAPPDGMESIDAPMVGMLYRQSAPDKPVYAAEGDLVSRNQTIGLIEVMKTLTPIRAPRHGRLEKWLVEDGEPVHQGQAIAWLAAEDDSGLL